MARELRPEEIHVALVVFDGFIDTEFARYRFPDIVASPPPPDGILNPAGTSENDYQLYCQPHSA